MADTSPKNQDALLHDYTPPPKATRTPRRGEEVWRLSKDGAILICELLDDSRVDAGWEVVLRRDDELIVGHRCGSEADGRHAADVFKRDHLRTDWQDVAPAAELTI